MAYFFVKECKSCEGTYSKKEVSEEEYQAVLKEWPDSETEYYGDDEYIVTRGCCKECEEEYYQLLTEEEKEKENGDVE